MYNYAEQRNRNIKQICTEQASGSSFNDIDSKELITL